MRNILLLIVGLVSCVTIDAGELTKSQNHGLTVHEWGTFTSVQGSDGNLIRWNPFETDALPSFVYDRLSPLSNAPSESKVKQIQNRLFAKARKSWLQRMETPVIYAYNDKALNLDVRIDFPKGEITEWYPQVSGFGPTARLNEIVPATRDSFVEWQNVRIESHSSDKGEVIPAKTSSNHYFEARGVSSNLLTAHNGLTKEFKPQTEQFLFYRGVGDFSAPLSIKFNSPQNFLIRNSGKEVIPFLLLIEVRGDQAGFSILPALAAKEKQQTRLTLRDSWIPVADMEAQVTKALETALVDSGLFLKEAQSMVATWRKSWLTEPGTRILYILPRKWTDTTLPLQLDPKPDHLERVMVGRAEVIAPSIESELQSLYVAYNRGEINSKVASQKFVQLGLGRFSEPALSRLQIMRYEKVASVIAGLKFNIQEASQKTVEGEKLAQVEFID
ncbi:hypothetical protein OAM01_02360 [bacterium]|nr:hypothetical protein [bacterium]